MIDVVADGPGADCTGTPWVAHGTVVIEQWLNDFFWRGAPLARFIAGVDVA